jgi:YQGE family putative transporter
LQILPYITAGLNAPLHTFKPLKKSFLNEISHYHKLSVESRRLLLSILLFTIALPLLSVFVNSFLWRNSHSVGIILLYNIATFIGMPLGFFVNSWLLKKYSGKILYFWGSLLQGFIVAIILFCPASGIATIASAGIAMGLVSGVYWANRILIGMYSTTSQQRTYFVSLELILVTLMGILMPLFIGWFIVTGDQLFSNWSQMAYQVLACLLIIAMFFSGQIVLNNKVVVPKMENIVPIKVTRRWKRLRLLSVIAGMSHGMEVVLPGLLVLLLVGTERSLGTIMALSGVFVSVALYQIAKKVGKRYRMRTFFIAAILSVSGGLIFGSTFSAAGAIVYFILNSFASTFRGTILGPTGLDVIMSESAKQKTHSYLYLADREFFVNIGRNIALGSLFILYYYYQNFALQIAPVLFALPLLGGVWVLSLIEKQLVWEDFISLSPVYCYLKSWSQQKN